ncbi:MAG: hypothetical protein JNL02_16700 [Saprospiraceae bacterium]|nr:hypothetical protein [Saprospiraceae bacterium]
MKIQRPLLTVVFSVFCFAAFAQSYKTAAGIRVDRGVNFTVQQYLFNNWTAEGILHAPLGNDNNNFGVTLLAERHRKIIFRGTNFYYGAGAHYYWQNDLRKATETDPGVTASNIAGLSFIGGAEISLGRLNLSVDWKPELHLNSGTEKAFNWNGASISARYIIDKRERKKVRDWKVWDKRNDNKNKQRKRR